MKAIFSDLSLLGKHGTQDKVARLIKAGDVLQAARELTQQDDLSRFDEEFLEDLRAAFPTPFLNVGSGPTFAYPLWANVDAVRSVHNPNPVHLSADSSLPFGAEAFELVYSSHALEHLEPATVDHVLREARRVLTKSGALLVKIPDYEALLGEWRSGSPRLVRDDLWNFASIVPTLKNRGHTDSVHTRTAYVFCGFWNKNFGNVFEKYDVNAPGAYNGPAAMHEHELARVLDGGPPARIAAIMRQHVIATESDYTFNHQNAWSRSEFEQVLNEAGFDLCSVDAPKILERFAYVPRLTQMYEISAFFLAFPRK